MSVFPALRSLNFKINLAIAVILVIVLSGSAIVTLSRQDLNAVANTKAKARLVSETVTNIIKLEMEGHYRKDISKLIRIVGQFEDIETLRIFNPDGVILHSVDKGEVGKEIDELVLAVFQSSDRSTPFKSPEKGHRSFCMVDVVFNDPVCQRCHNPKEDIIGVLEVCLSMETAEKQILSNAKFLTGATGGTLLLVSLAISGLISFMVVKPIRALVSNMAKVQEGDLEVRAKIDKGDELGKLGISFDKMVARLDQTSREVERLHEEQMMRAERLASIGEMAASVAHEIKNPLAGLAGATHVLNKSFEEDDSRKEVAAEMVKLTDRLDKTIKDLLSFAKMEETAWGSGSINEAVERALFFVRQDESRRSLKIETDLDEHVPPLPMDSEKIVQVMLNLILNACHAAGAEGRVLIATSDKPTSEDRPPYIDDTFAEILVEDSGPGIPLDAINDIFKPFFTTKTMGTGLGLPICRNIVEAHDGKIMAHSPEDGPTRFYVWLRK